MLKSETRVGDVLKAHDASVGHLKMRPNIAHMAVGVLCALGMTWLQFQLIPTFGLPALTSIIFFNGLFVFLLFPLEGPLTCKTVLLLAGNMVGIVYYMFQMLLQNMFVVANTDVFRSVILVGKPLIDFVWIVTVWSISLSVLASYRTKQMETT